MDIKSLFCESFNEQKQAELFRDNDSVWGRWFTIVLDEKKQKM
jgi:hypothetical protein